MTPLSFATVISARIFIDGAMLSVPEVAGGIFAVVLWSTFLFHVRSRTQWICGLFILNLVVQGLSPFVFSEQSRSYVWIPFYSLFVSAPQIGVPAFLEKCFLYGTLTWLLVRTGRGYAVSAAFGITVTGALSVVHLYTDSRSAEITDSVLVALMAALVRVAAGPLSVWAGMHAPWAKEATRNQATK